MKIQNTFYLILLLFFSCDLEPFPEAGGNCALDGTPEAKISVNTNACNVSDCTITFDAAQSSNACSYKWDLDGNISTIEKEGVSIQHIFTQIGMNTVTLRIENSNGEIDTEEVIINVNSGQVMSLFEVASSTNNSYAPSIVNFTNLSINGDSYEWNFGDPTSGNNNTSTEESPSHLYANPGIYTTSLKVTNSSTGTDNIQEKTITINNVTTFSKTYGDTGVEIGNSVIQTSNGNYAMVGTTYSFGNGGDIYLILIDKDGNELPGSGKTYGGIGDDAAYSIIQTQSGGFAIVGSTLSFGAGGSDMYLILTDENGNELPGSGKTYGGTGDDVAYSIVQTQSGNFAIVGDTREIGISQKTQMYLVLTDENGNKLPNSGKYFGGDDYEFSSSIIETQNGNLAIVGTTNSFGNGGGDIYLILTDENGNELPNSGKTYGTPEFETGADIIERNNGEFAIVGKRSESGMHSDVYLILIDANGNELSNSGQLYGLNQYIDTGQGIVEINSNKYAILGKTDKNGLSEDIYLILTDENGLELSNSGKSYGGSEVEYPGEIIKTIDGGFAIIGSTGSSGNGNLDFYFIKTDANGNL